MASGEFEGLDQLVNRVTKALHAQKVLNAIGLGAQRLIQQRTREGKDVEGKPFAAAPTAEAGSPYSPGHRKKREKKGLPTAKVNLQFSLYDGMLSQIDHVVTRDFDGVQLLIDDEEKEQIAMYHNVQGAGKSKVIRKFWGLTDQEMEQLADLAQAEIGEVLSLNNLT